MSSYVQAIETIAAGVVASRAVEVDQERLFPGAAIDALREAGLLGLISSKSVGGMGEGPRAAATVVERMARECGSTAMVTCMHYAAAAVIEQYGSDRLRREVARGAHLLTLAFSEAGSRSHFWAPLSTARLDDGGAAALRTNGTRRVATKPKSTSPHGASSRRATSSGSAGSSRPSITRSSIETSPGSPANAEGEL